MSSAVSGKRALPWNSPFSSVADGGKNRGMSSPWALVTQPHLLLQNRLSLWAMQHVFVRHALLLARHTLVHVNVHTEHNHASTYLSPSHHVEQLPTYKNAACEPKNPRKPMTYTHTHTHVPTHTHIHTHMHIHPHSSLFFLMTHPHTSAAKWYSSWV